MKVALAQQNYTIGDFDLNAEKIISAIKRAENEKVDIVLFSELCVCGYPPKDFLEFNDFILRSEEAIRKIAIHTYNVAAVIGAPLLNPEIKGKDLFNAAFFLYQGEIKFIARKTLLPTYDVFDEVRYFESNNDFGIINFKGKKIGITICEDLWNIGSNPLYTKTPMDELIKFNPDFILNISASPFDFNHSKERKIVLQEVAVKYNLPIFYCNTVGAQTELIFDGGSMVFNSSGNIIQEMKYFEEDFQIIDLKDIEKTKDPIKILNSKSQLIYEALMFGIKDYFKKLNFKQAVIGLSGGVDSALVLVLAERALGKENVKAVLMPSEYSSQHSIDDAIHLCSNLGVVYETIPIKNLYESYLNTLTPFFQNKAFNLTEENLQARIRAGILMALCNKHNYILLNTSNKSEAAVGYGTLYGDMCGGLSVLGDIYKTEVYEICNYINLEKEIIPKNILSKAPSAELRPNQKDSDSLPEYDILDKVLYQYIEKRKGPRELLELGFEKNLIDRVLKLVNTSEYKRHQTPPILRVSPKAFGSGRRIPIVGKYLS